MKRVLLTGLAFLTLAAGCIGLPVRKPSMRRTSELGIDSSKAALYEWRDYNKDGSFQRSEIGKRTSSFQQGDLFLGIFPTQARQGSFAIIFYKQNEIKTLVKRLDGKIRKDSEVTVFKNMNQDLEPGKYGLSYHINKQELYHLPFEITK